MCLLVLVSTIGCASNLYELLNKPVSAIVSQSKDFSSDGFIYRSPAFIGHISETSSLSAEMLNCRLPRRMFCCCRAY